MKCSTMLLAALNPRVRIWVEISMNKESMINNHKVEKGQFAEKSVLVMVMAPYTGL